MIMKVISFEFSHKTQTLKDKTGDMRAAESHYFHARAAHMII